MPERQDEKPDDDTAIVRAVEEVIGGKLVEEGETMFADPAMEKRYRELMAKERERKANRSE